MTVNGHCLGLIAACPNHKVRLLYVLLLLFACCSEQAYPLLLAGYSVEVKLFGVASQPSERVDIPILFAVDIEVRVVRLKRLFFVFEKDPDFVAVQNLYLHLWEFQFGPVFVPKEAEAFANADAGLFLIAIAAVLALLGYLAHSVWHCWVLSVRRPVEQHPRT